MTPTEHFVVWLVRAVRFGASPFALLWQDAFTEAVEQSLGECEDASLPMLIAALLHTCGTGQRPPLGTGRSAHALELNVVAPTPDSADIIRYDKRTPRLEQCNICLRTGRHS